MVASFRAFGSFAGDAEGKPYPFVQTFEFLCLSQVTFSRRGDADIGRAVRVLFAERPDALGGEIEEHGETDDHEGGSEPDDVRAGILGHLKAGETALPNKGEGQPRHVPGLSLDQTL